MSMLHSYQEASRMQIPFPKHVAKAIPGRELLLLLCGVNQWLEEEPSVYLASQGKSLLILYPNVAFHIADFWESFCLSMANIHRIWPICALGTAQNQETVRLLSMEKHGSLVLVQQSLSGKPASALETLCFQVDCNDEETAGHLFRILTAINWRVEIAALSWKDANFLHEQMMFVGPDPGGLYCYAGLDSDCSTRDRLLSLDFAQKNSLWSAFLKDGLEPMEFEWLAEEIAEDTLSNRMEWELALREVIEKLQFRVVNQEKSFELFDASGNRLYLGADDRHAAAWSLLKILFPLNYQ